uniref:Uncharacterized protein n=1 Tax=Arion vulgaris TaxID=1028688 RepID=A0A0B7A4Z4_9EUPU
MGSLTVVINQFLDNLFKVHATSLRMSTRSDVGKLHQAVKEDNANIVSTLIENGADVNIVYQQETAFTRAVTGKYFNSADVIITSRQFDPNSKNQFEKSPLFVAAKVGRVDYVKKLLNMGAQVNDADIRGNTPLSACTWDDHHEVAEVLIQSGANVDQADHLGQTPLHRACSNVSLKVVQILLRHNCDVDLQTREKKTALMTALPSYYNSQVAGKKISDMLCICEMLVKAGCSLNSQDDKGKTPLHLAVEANDIYGTCLLAESGCELNMKDDLGYTPFQTAILPKRCLYDIARYLLYYGADVTQEMKLPDETSSRTASPLTLILNTQPTSDELEKKWSRALLLRSMWRSVYPNRSIIKSYEESYNSVNSDHTFYEAIERDVLEWLNSCMPCSLQHQATLTVRRTLGSTNIVPRINLLPVASGLKQCLSLGLRSNWMPLSKTCLMHLYIIDGQNDKIDNIIKSGTDVNIPINNKTPLALALEIGNMEAAKMILKSCQQSNSNVVNASGDNALHIAAKYGRHELIDDIAKICPKLDSKNCKGHTPLQEAIQAGHFTTAVILINKGADVKIDEGESIPLLHLAAASGADDVVRILLEKGVDPNMEDKFRNTPLHVAASKGFEYLQVQIPLPALYEDVVSASLDTIQITMTNSMPKYTKNGTHHANVIECLIQNGADTTRLNLQARTPLQCAQHFKAQELLAVLNGKIRVPSK